MATTCNTTIAFSVVAAMVKALDISSPSDSLPGSFSGQLTSGTGAANANKAWQDSITIVGGATSTTILRGGAITDSFGDVVSLAKIKLLWIYNVGAGEVVACGGSNPVPFTDGTTDHITIPVGGYLILFAGITDTDGWVVTATTGCNLNITADGTGAVVQVLVVGINA